MVENVNRDELKNRIADMGAFLKEQLTAINEYDRPLHGGRAALYDVKRLYSRS